MAIVSWLQRRTGKEIGMVVGVVLVFGYLAIARTSSQSAQRHTPSVDGDCIERLNIATNGKVSLQELEQRCIR